MPVGCVPDAPGATAGTRAEDVVSIYRGTWYSDSLRLKLPALLYYGYLPGS